MSDLDTLRIQRGAEHLHRLGPRAIAEFIIQIAEAAGQGALVVETLEHWRFIDPAVLNAVLAECCGGRQFPPALVVVVVEGSRP